MIFDSLTAMQAQGFGGHFGGDVGVAVAVAADPRGEFEPGVGRAQFGVVAGKRIFEVFVNGGQGIPEKRVDKIQARFDFVCHGQFRGADAVCKPER